MSLKEAIDRYGRGLIVPQPRSDPSLKLGRTVAELELRFDKSAALGLRERKALVQRLRAAASVNDFSALSGRDLKCAADYLFEPSERLIQFPGFLERYMAALAESGTGAALVRLLSIYCIHFDPQSLPIREIAAFLRRHATRLPALWRRRHESFCILDPSKAARMIGEALVDAAAPRDALGSVGLSGRRGASGMATHVVRNAVDILRARLEREASLDHVHSIVRWASPDGKSLYVQATRAAIADALLMPWRARQPPGPVRQTIERFLIAAMQDPRLHPGGWIEVSESAKLVFRRWLAENSIEQFLRVVDRVAVDHQWRFRRTFWKAYFDNDFILDAWVAFSTNGASLARQIELGDVGGVGCSYAVLRGPRAPDHAVLLLQFGDLLVADWSHNGKVRIWSRPHPRRPDLYETSYDADALRSPADFEESHWPQGRWQHLTHEFIRKCTGIELSRTQYMPNDWRGMS